MTKNFINKDGGLDSFQIWWGWGLDKKEGDVCLRRGGGWYPHAHYECEAVYFGECKQSSKSRSYEHKRSIRNRDCDKSEIAKHCWEANHNFRWDQKKVVDRESRLILRNIKETMHCLSNPNHINKMLPGIWLPNSR